MTNSWVAFHFSFCVWCCKISAAYFFLYRCFCVFCVPMPMKFNNIILMIFAFGIYIYFYTFLYNFLCCLHLGNVELNDEEVSN